MMAKELHLDYLNNLEELKHAHSQLCVEEEGVSNELVNLLDQRSHLENKMYHLFKMLPNLQLVHSDSQQLLSMISFTSTLAENISSKVRQLDLAKSRVTDCINHIEDILDLKFCTDGVKTALQNENYEQAAVHIHRFLSLDENVLKHTAQDVTEGSSLDNSFSLLHDAESKLKVIVTRKFDEAVRDEDLASVERFFKIFPLLNQHEEGLKKFSQYLCSQIADTSQNNLKLALSNGPGDKRANIIFADTITLLFEGIARIVEIHQPLIETYYGPGYLILALEIIQRECDRQVRRIVEEFKKSRNLQQKISNIHRLLSSSSSYRNVDRLEPRELDVLLSELTLLNARAELYLRFIRRRLTNDIDSLPLGNKKTEKLAQLEKLLKDCELSRLMQELLGHYIMIEQYFMRESITKAVKMDVIEEGSVTSNVVDDVFFILKKCIKRALSSGSIDGVCAVINNCCTVLESDFWEVLHNQLCIGFPSATLDLSQAYTVIQSSLQQGKLSTDEPDKARMIFLVTINNAEVAIEYILTLKKTTQEEIERQLINCKDSEKAKLESCLSDLSNLPNKFKSLVDFGMNQLSSSAIKPQIKPWLDTFTTISHVITEDEFANYEANDPFVQNFIVNIDGLLSSFKNFLTSSNYDSLISILTAEATSYLEKIAMKTTFNRLGGLQFDKEIRALITYFTNITTWTVRDKFARLIQMATVLNLEKVEEILEYWGSNSGSLTWRLTPNEVRQVLSLRLDFESVDIRRLKL